MDRNELNRNGGCNKGNTGITTVWKMKKVTGIGCSGWDITQIKLINGLFMDFLREKDMCI